VPTDRGASLLSASTVKPNSRIEVAICAGLLVTVRARVSGVGDQRRAPPNNRRVCNGKPRPLAIQP